MRYRLNFSLVLALVACGDGPPEPGADLGVVDVQLDGDMTDAVADAADADTFPDADDVTPDADAFDPDVPPRWHPELGELNPGGAGVMGRFITSVSCGACHSTETDGEAMWGANGENLGFQDNFRATMMANSARDPIWRAAVSAEVAAHPDAAAEIEDLCMRCHAPMGWQAAYDIGQQPVSTDLLHERGALSMIALDGASCALCHQITDVGLGTPESFGGGYNITQDLVTFGPFDDPVEVGMETDSNYSPAHGPHIGSAALCATCHTLFTDPVDAEGNPVGTRFAEQTPYLEWQNSIFNDEIDTPAPEARPCQGCHVPREDREGRSFITRIARRPLGGEYATLFDREPVGRHSFIGGNTLVPALLRDNRRALSPVASDEEFDALVERVLEQLAEETAVLTIDALEESEGVLRFDATVENLTGHKFPTGYPARRAWLHVTVEGPGGEILAQSGHWNTAGQLLDAEGEPLAAELVGGPTYPHFDRVEDLADVVVFETVMENSDGEVTFELTRGVRYRKDNRLLPSGWSDDFPGLSDIAPAGLREDLDFSAGGDRVHFEIPAIEGAAAVTVSLVYQTFSARSLAELLNADTPATRDLAHYLEGVDLGPKPVASDRAELP